jgi:hypothetical protein
LDQDTGLVTFSGPSGIVAIAPAQIVGTYNPADRTWLWAWHNATVEPKLREHAEVARHYGETHGVAELTNAKFVATEDKCWELAAVTCKLANDQGIYRGSSGATKVFIAFGELEMRKSKSHP